MPPIDENVPSLTLRSKEILEDDDPVVTIGTSPPSARNNALPLRPETERASSFPGISPKSEGGNRRVPLPLDNIGFPEYSPTSKYPPSPTSVQAKLLELKTGKQTPSSMHGNLPIRPMSARVSRNHMRPLHLACSAASPAERYGRSPWPKTPRRPKSKKRITSPRKSKGTKEGKKNTPRGKKQSPRKDRKRTPRTGQPATSPFMVDKSFTFPSTTAVTVLRPEAKNNKTTFVPPAGLARKDVTGSPPSFSNWDLSLNLMPSSSDEGTKARMQDLHKDMDGRVIQLEALIAAQSRIQELEKANDVKQLKIEELTRQLRQAMIRNEQYKKDLEKSLQRGRSSPRYTLFGNQKEKDFKYNWRNNGNGKLPIKSLTPSPRLRS